MSEQDMITATQTAIEKRTAKIQNVDEKIKRQNEHIEKTELDKARYLERHAAHVGRVTVSQERYLEHRARWVAQNERDMLRLSQLGVAEYSPVKDEVSE